MVFGPLSGLICSDLILNQNNEFSELFKATRFTPIASAKEFIKTQMDVAKHFIIDRLTTPDATIIETLPKGEGCVVHLGTQKIAASRDSNGNLKTHSALCPHMYCILKWNTSEKTFDCPCHGSRFDTEGRPIDGPALQDLEDISIDFK